MIGRNLTRLTGVDWLEGIDRGSHRVLRYVGRLGSRYVPC